LVLMVQCPDVKGVVAAVAGYLAAQDCSISESHQFNDAGSGQFFMRVAFRPGAAAPSIDHLEASFTPIAAQYGMEWSLHDIGSRPRVVIAVSKFGHCLFDLLHRWRTGLLKVDIVAVISNHDDMRSFTEWCGLPYIHLPVDPADKTAQQTRFIEVVEECRADVVILARYMQILSPQMCEALLGKCINIHHSFLPSFKGARPYHQAHGRGVKIIGATAHYVTTDLDEGPIIEQGVERVSHALGPEALVNTGRDIECAVLARAVTWHLERRVMLNGNRTVVFA
jgi:formyltetrahydrofolate deformylase